MVGRLLPRAFFARHPAVVAAELVGAQLICGGVQLQITEVEAYAGPDDPASHAVRRTPRSAGMYGHVGRLYVYLSYGIHWCANIVAHQAGTAGAVLLRCGELRDGLALAQARRPQVSAIGDLARGPGRLTATLGIDGDYDGAQVCGAHRVVQVRAGNPVSVRVAPRIGISRAVTVPWRFYDADSAVVSRVRKPR